MIDFSILNKKKKYLGLQYGTSFIAKEIRKFSKSYAKNSKRIPTHVFALVYRFGEWWIFESHIKGFPKLEIPEGVRHYKANAWLQIESETQNEFEAIPFEFSLKKLEENIGRDYGTGDIKALMKAALFNSNGKQKDRKGLICSEFLAICNSQICDYYKLPAYCITPAHFQDYIDMHKESLNA